LGAGARGELNLATLARRHPGQLRFAAVAEPQDDRREHFGKLFNIPKENIFRDWQELLDRPRLADAIINALPCRLHYESAISGLRAGYHTLLEKPMALTPRQCLHLTSVAERSVLLLMISLQSRYNKIYTRMRNLFDLGKIGRLMAIDCAENIGYWHFILSYVRGIHHHSSLSHSFVLAKGVHDIDLITWFAGAPAKKVSSFGSLAFFKEENAPSGAPERCLDGCPVFETCEFNAYKQFVEPGRPALPWSLISGASWDAYYDYLTNPRFRTLASVIVHDISRGNRLLALRETPSGRCVFRSENNVVDHQTVSIEYQNGVVASFLLNGFSLIWERSLNLHGTGGEIRSADFSGRLETRTYSPARAERERIPYHGIIHGGGDEVILLKFAEAVRKRQPAQALVSVRNCLESHLICFAAEEARLSGQVVDMADFRQRASAGAGQDT
jgi:predicted dehydrogenase